MRPSRGGFIFSINFHRTNLGDGAGFVEFSKSPEAEAPGAHVMIRDISREAGVHENGCMQAIRANPVSMHNDQSKLQLANESAYD
jgi:hypothetical protein